MLSIGRVTNAVQGVCVLDRVSFLVKMPIRRPILSADQRTFLTEADVLTVIRLCVRRDGS